MRHSGQREVQLISLASEGLTDKQIGVELGISSETVASHWKRLLTKHHARSRTELIARVLRAEAESKIEVANAELDRLKSVLEDRRRLGSRQSAAIARLQALMDSIDVGVVFKSPERRIVFANSRLVQLFELGDDAADLLGMNCIEAIRAAGAAFKDANAFARIQTQVMDDEAITEPFMLPLSSGRLLEVSYVPIEGVGPTSHLFLFRDVTKERKHEERLKSLVALADLLTEVAPSLIAGSDQCTIHRTLERIGRYAGADRAWIYELLEDGVTAERTFVWTAEGPTQPVKISLLLGDKQLKMYGSGQTVIGRKSTYKDLVHPDTHAQLEKWDVRCFVSAPIMENGKFVAYLGMASGQDENLWDEDTAQILQRFAAMLGAYRQKLSALQAAR